MSHELQNIMNDFHDSLIAFIDELIEQFPEEADLIIVRLFLKDTIPPIQIINTFIKEALPHKDSIKARDENFFLDGHLTVFNNFNKGKVNHFKVLWKSSSLDENDRQVIWKWFDMFIYLAEKYQKIKLNY